jgi:hypothetical protein
MAALYWGEALALPRGALAALVTRSPGVGYAAILAGTCAASYLVAGAHYGAHAAAGAAWRRVRRG